MGVCNDDGERMYKHQDADLLIGKNKRIMSLLCMCACVHACAHTWVYA